MFLCVFGVSKRSEIRVEDGRGGNEEKERERGKQNILVSFGLSERCEIKSLQKRAGVGRWMLRVPSVSNDWEEEGDWLLLSCLFLPPLLRGRRKT
jgi:hypothetical protein